MLTADNAVLTDAEFVEAYPQGQAGQRVMVAALHLQPTSARSAQCRGGQEGPAWFVQLPACGPAVLLLTRCGNCIDVHALTEGRWLRSVRTPSFPSCRCKLHVSQPKREATRRIPPTWPANVQDVQARWCRPVGPRALVAARRRPAAASHAAAQRPQRPVQRRARRARRCGGRRRRRRAGGVCGAGAPHRRRRRRGHAPLLQVRTRRGQAEGPTVHALPSHPIKHCCPLRRLCRWPRRPWPELQRTPACLPRLGTRECTSPACRSRASTGRPLGDALVRAGAAQGAPGSRGQGGCEPRDRG